MHIERNDFRVEYTPDVNRITCAGSLELRGDEGYKEIADLLNVVVERAVSADTITLDLRELEFLNSSGITTLARFMIALRNKGGISLRIQGSKKHTWQARSMPGLQKLMQDKMEFRDE